MKYLFLLGRNPALSEAELKSMLPNPSSLQIIGSNFASYEGSLLCPPQLFLDRLGGTIKILEVLGEKIPFPKIEDFCFERLLEKFSDWTGKAVFSLSVFGSSTFRVHEILMNSKKRLKQKGLKPKFLNKNFQNVSHVAVFEENLIDKGLDLTIINEKNQNIIAKTVAIQNIEAYGKRDYGKPFRDPKSGMLPPKLAQILLNLATKGKSQYTILDPFCGTGTVLMEAMLMGFSVIGSDADEKMVGGTKQNLEWLKKNFPIDQKIQSFIFQKDAAQISPSDLPQNIINNAALAIVTEPFLGPPLSKFPPPPLLAKIQKELFELYYDFFKNLKKWLPQDTPITILFPAFRKSQNQWAFLDAMIEKIPSTRGVLLYERPDQIVGREIITFIL